MIGCYEAQGWKAFGEGIDGGRVAPDEDVIFGASGLADKVCNAVISVYIAVKHIEVLALGDLAGCVEGKAFVVAGGVVAVIFIIDGNENEKKDWDEGENLLFGLFLDKHCDEYG